MIGTVKLEGSVVDACDGVLVCDLEESRWFVEAFVPLPAHERLG